MTTAEELRSGKGHRDENFPVASRVIHPRHRGAILAFYNFVRTADDVADHATLTAEQKLSYLDRMDGTLTGRNDDEAVGVALRSVLESRGLGPQHAQDLLTAFRLDVTKQRYEDWDDLIDYCRYSAMPVGRYVLDIHGEDRATWAANDALCAALQVINHLQDCGKDYRDLNRVYLPRDAMAKSGAEVEMLGAPEAAPPLRHCLTALAERTDTLLRESRAFSGQIRDLRLSLEVSIIQTAAEKLVQMLRTRDPLRDRVHLGKAGFAGQGLLGLARGALGRLRMPRPAARAA